MKFYVTTPIYYVNAEPHIGHSYTTIAADALARYHRLCGDEVFFLTGTDEHGQKIAEMAKARNLTPQALADEVSSKFRDAWKALDISYSRFIRTTEPAHEAVVKQVFAALLAKGALYAGEYRGYYCIQCESYVTPGDTDAAPVCPDCGRPVKEISEPSYFFKLSEYSGRLRKYIVEHPGFVKPDFRYNEVLNFIDRGLHDLSVTRKNIAWGVASPTPEGYPIYVWFDALVNYLTGVGYLQDEASFSKLWPPNVQLIAKDIIKFHHIVWPSVLLALDLPLPETIFAHGYWTMGQDKMSKSKGNIVSPLDLAADYGVSAVRYFVLREVPFGLDGEYSSENFKKRYNSDLANDLGNLVNRTLNLVEKKCGNLIPDGVLDETIAALAEEVFAAYDGKMRALSFSEAIEAAWRMVTRLNKYIDEKAPWRLEGKAVADVLYTVVEGIRVAALFLTPFIPATARDIWAMLGLTDNPSELSFGARNQRLQPGRNLGARTILFPRRT